MSYTIKEIRVPDIEITRDSTTAKRRFRLDNWSSIEEFVSDLDGSVKINGNIVTRTGFATYPGKPWLLMKSIKIGSLAPSDVGDKNSFGVAGAMPGHTVVDVDYETVPFDQSGQQNDDPDIPQLFMTHEINTSTQMVTHSTSSFKWEKENNAGSTEIPPDILPGFPVTLIDHRISWENLPHVNWGAIGRTLNRVNSTVFLGHPVETVWFGSFTASRARSSDGLPRWKLGFDFKARLIEPAKGIIPGWNHFLRPNPKEADSPWQKILIKNTEKPILALADLNDAFKFAA